VKYVNNAMKQLQEATEKLGNLNVPGSSPWGSLHQMQQVFNHEFWQNIHQLASMAQNQTANPNPHHPISNASIPKKKAPETETKPPISPRFDLFETLGRVIICLELAGLDRNSLKMSVTGGTVLNLVGKIKKPDLSTYLLQQERVYGKFSRKISLPSPVFSEGLKTTYKDGLLEIQLIKRNTQQTTEVSQLDSENIE